MSNDFSRRSPRVAHELFDGAGAAANHSVRRNKRRSADNESNVAGPGSEVDRETVVDEGSTGAVRQHASINQRRSRDDERTPFNEGTVVGEETVVDEGSTGSVRHHTSPSRLAGTNHLTINTEERSLSEDFRSIQSPSRNREAAHRLDDDLTLLQAERQVSHTQEEEKQKELTRSRSMYRSVSRREETQDDFDYGTTQNPEKGSIYRPPEHPNTSIGKLYKKIHRSSWLVRYFVYITPPVLVILLPLLLGVLLFPKASVGGVYLTWFCIWLEIVWLTLWAGRILAKCLPWPIGLIASLFTNNSKKWRDMGKQLEVPATLFFWGLALEISFLPTMKSHHIDGNKATQHWETVMNKVIISIFVALVLNFAEKIIIQLIAISFHIRTYADRIASNKFQIDSLVKLYTYSKEKIGAEDKDFADASGPASGTRTPKQLVKEAQKNTVEALNKFGDVAGKIAADFTGREVAVSTHPHQVILTLLATNAGSQVLARRLYRTFCRDDSETVHSDDLRPAFDDEADAEAAFTMFDKDMNGDIAMEELEAVCVEVGRERKSITASLKDLDSVVGKLDDVFIFIVMIIAILVFISLISTSAAGVLTSAGSAVLALSWLFSATAQEFLQSIIFVFVKHPFDVGDRVSIYGNTGTTLKGDDYFVKEISLLYTEFKKMEGHIVQAPNSLLNTLFILNQRRSSGLAEAVPVTIKFGTTLVQIEHLRMLLLEFVKSKKREYQPNVLTELRDVTEAHSITLNVIFFYKSNWQNELLRLTRRNEFICALMVSMQELEIEGPRMRYPGQKESFPMYLQQVPHISTPNTGRGGHPDNPGGSQDWAMDPPFVQPPRDSDIASPARHASPILSSKGRARGESLAQMGRRVDFSLGMRDVASSNLTGDVYEDRQRIKLPPSEASKSRSQDRSSDRERTSLDLVRRSTSTSEQPKLARIGTDSSMARQRSNHRNRFFGRSKDVDVSSAMESGMADIPETFEHSRLDPRSGLVSPAAWRDSTEESQPTPSVLPSLSGERPGKAEQDKQDKENYEMRRLD